jgi:hypothetical protein
VYPTIVPGPGDEEAATTMHDTATRSSLPRNLGAFALTLAAYASAVSTAQAQTGD